MLGNVLAEVRDGGDPTIFLAERLDIVLLARAETAAAETGESLQQFAHDAVQHFIAHASEADWAQLIGRLRDGEPAAAATLDLALRHLLAQREKHGGH